MRKRSEKRAWEERGRREEEEGTGGENYTEAQEEKD